MNLIHAGVGLALLSIIQRYVVTLTPKKLLLLQFPDLSESLELTLMARAGLMSVVEMV